jgi:hypothetical protein
MLILFLFSLGWVGLNNAQWNELMGATLTRVVFPLNQLLSSFAAG